MKSILTLTVIAATIATAMATDIAQSPRGVETAAAAKVVPGISERRAIEFSSGKAAQAVECGGCCKAAGRDRDLVREQRSVVYSGKNAPTRTFEVAPVK